MIKKHKLYIILSIWFLILIVLVAISLKDTKNERVNDTTYNQMYEAAMLASSAFDKIKEYKILNGIGISEEDTLETGLIGSKKRTAITTTEGVLEAKRTSANPDWAAVLIKVFKKAGLKEGDEIGMVFSGSFPALNICAMAASQTYGLKTCIMASIGASYYGANQENFTFLDMSLYLYKVGIFQKTIDYVSLGGANDIGDDFHKESVKAEIIQRINESGIKFIQIEDYKTNIDTRLKYLHEDVPNIKLFINVGGTLVGFGEGLHAFTESGYFKGYTNSKSFDYVLNKRDDKYGLLQSMRLMGVDIFSMKDMKTLSETYSIDYDPSKLDVIGTSKVYYENKYNVIYALVGIIMSIALSVYLYIIRKKGVKKQ